MRRIADMPRGLIRGAPIPLVALLALLGVSACGTEALVAVDRPPPAEDPQGQVPGVSTRLLENFDNQMLVHEITGALLDVTQGIVTLPVEEFPRVEGSGVDTFERRVEHNGLVEAEQILVTPMGALEASDAVEMRARDVVRIEGTIRAGRGGVTLVGGRGVYVDGTIESRGPVRILVEAADGEIEIAGRVAVHASADDIEDTPPNIDLLGRGAVRITGVIESLADHGRPGGDVRVQVYGPVKVRGPTARITATATGSGVPGAIRLRSEAGVTLAEGAVVGRPLYPDYPEDQDVVLGGSIELQGTDVRIETEARVEAGDGHLKGGSVFLTAGEALALDSFSVVRSGSGPVGGTLLLRAKRIGIGHGSLLEAGSGRSNGAHFEIDAVERLDVVSEAVIRGGSTSCGPGGALVVAVGGAVRVRDGASIRGGDGAVDFGDRVCMTTAQGGDVVVQAWSVDGLEQAVLPGRGFPDGEVSIELDASLEVQPANLAIGTAGQIVSKIIDRGEGALGQAPALRDASIDAPEGTRVTIELCGAEALTGPYEPCVDTADAAGLEVLRDSRFFRYRVRLSGRVFDAPVLDYFELDLSPED